MIHPVRAKRTSLIITLVLVVFSIVGLILYALKQNINLFFTPTQVMSGEAPDNIQFRLGGMVKKGSVKKAGDSLAVRFVLTDYQKEVPVIFEGVLPALFREGQGIVASGELSEDSTFLATQVLAKHDENYMPPELKGMAANAPDFVKSNQ